MAPRGVTDARAALASPGEAFRVEGAALMAERGDPSGLPVLLSGMFAPQPQVRRRAARGLRALGEADAMPVLMEALEDTDEGVRDQAARALGTIGTLQAVRALLDAEQTGMIRYGVLVRTFYDMGLHAAAPLMSIVERGPEGDRRVERAMDLLWVATGEFKQGRSGWLEWWTKESTTREPNLPRPAGK